MVQLALVHPTVRCSKSKYLVNRITRSLNLVRMKNSKIKKRTFQKLINNKNFENFEKILHVNFSEICILTEVTKEVSEQNYISLLMQ